MADHYDEKTLEHVYVELKTGVIEGLIKAGDDAIDTVQKIIDILNQAKAKSIPTDASIIYWNDAGFFIK